MKKNPYPLPSFAQDSAPLDWETFFNRGRRHRGGVPSPSDATALMRLAAEGDFPLDMEHEGRSMLSAALSHWGRHHVNDPNQEALAELPQPGERVTGEWRNACWPEIIAGILIHRGADPFFEFDRFRTGQERPDIQGQRSAHDTSSCVSPISLALESGLDSTVVQILRHPNSPPAATWDAIRLAEGPLLHMAVKHRPRLLAPLLAQGLDPNVRDEHGRTPLFDATRPDQVEALLAAGARPDLLNAQGVSAATTWQQMGVKDRSALLAVLKRHPSASNASAPLASALAPTPGVKVWPASPRVFDEALLGQRGRVPKGAAPLPEPIPVPGFAEPLSLVGHVLIGVVTDKGKNHTTLLEEVWQRATLGPVERALLAVAAAFNPVQDKLTAYESVGTQKKREAANVGRQWLVDHAKKHPARAEDVHALMPALLEFLTVRDPALEQVKALSKALLARAPTWGQTHPFLIPAAWEFAHRAVQLPLGDDRTWDPWDAYWQAVAAQPGQAVKGHWPSEIENHPVHVMRVLGVNLRSLDLSWPLQQPYNAHEWPRLDELKDRIATWEPEQWETLDRAGLTSQIEAQLAQVAPRNVNVPWAGAWTAARRHLRTVLAEPVAADGPPLERNARLRHRS